MSDVVNEIVLDALQAALDEAEQDVELLKETILNSEARLAKNREALTKRGNDIVALRKALEEYV